MKVCKPFGPNLLHEKSEYDTEPKITKEVPYLKQTLEAIREKYPPPLPLPLTTYCLECGAEAIRTQ